MCGATFLALPRQQIRQRREGGVLGVCAGSFAPCTAAATAAMPFGRKADARDASLSARVQAAAGARRIESAEDQALAAELRDYRPRPELHLATSPAGEEVWRQLVREREWWRRTSLCERVGHCKQTPITFLPMPGDVRVCVQTPRQLGPRDATSSILLEYGTWFEKDELAFVQRCLTRDARCVDIGANHGVYCLNMAKSACEGGVWAFEPASRTADLLETAKNANGLDSLHVCRAAVSDEPGTAEFVLEGEFPPRLPTLHSQLPPKCRAWSADVGVGAQAVVPSSTTS